MQRLLTSDGQQEKAFRYHIRQYNAALAFTSMGCKVDTRVSSRGGPKAFHVHGKVYHMQELLQANSPEDAQYAQLFFYDPNYAADLCHQRNPTLDRQVMGDLTQMLEHHNPYISVYQTAHERLQQMSRETDTDGSKVLLDARLSLVVEEKADRRRHNLSVANKVATILLGKETEEPTRRDIQLQLCGNANNPSGCQHIDQNHAAYMALHYVLLFPHGDVGWHWGMQLQSVGRERN